MLAGVLWFDDANGVFCIRFRRWNGHLHSGGYRFFIEISVSSTAGGWLAGHCVYRCGDFLHLYHDNHGDKPQKTEKIVCFLEITVDITVLKCYTQACNRITVNR